CCCPTCRSYVKTARCSTDTLSLHDALPIFGYAINTDPKQMPTAVIASDHSEFTRTFVSAMKASDYFNIVEELPNEEAGRAALAQDRKSTRLNSSHVKTSYAVFCLKKKNLSK